MNWQEIKMLARDLRKKQTPAEALLWKFLRNRNVMKMKFLRQHPLSYKQHGRRYFFIADFYCDEASLVLEVDGKVHDFQKDYDLQRDMILKARQLRTLRVTNTEVENDLASVITKIKEHLTAI